RRPHSTLFPSTTLFRSPFWIGSQKPASLQGAPRLVMFLTGPDYLRAMGIPLLRGRFFNPEDTTKSPCVMVIDSVFARTYFPDSEDRKSTRLNSSHVAIS